MAKKQGAALNKYAAILIFTLISIFPIIVYPEFYLGRQNDLNNFFSPLIIYVKNALINYHQLPLWNMGIFSGTPLVTDPQAPIFYLPNILHLILPSKSAFLFLAFFHLYLGGLGIYFYLNKNLKLNSHSSYLGTAIYLFSPRLAAYFEAGHVGLIYSWAYLPWVLLFLGKIVNKKRFANTLGLSISMAALFFTHTPTFYLVALIFPILYLMLLKNPGHFRKSISKILAGVIITFGLIAVSFLPQLAWQGTTTRQFLLQKPEIFPVWHSKWEFIQAAINPFFVGLNAVWDLDTEKYISLGMFSLALASVGLWNLNKKLKISVLLAAVFIGLIALGNASPIYPLLLKSKFFVLLRVMTRVWFIPVIAVSVLAPQGFAVLYKNKPRLARAMAIFTIAESLLLFWGRMAKPIIDATKAPDAVYAYLHESAKNERVFCTTKCLSYDKAALYQLELIEGYGTLAQKNYYQRAKVTMGTFWLNKYDLSIPPSWITYSEKLDPQAIYLAQYSVGYVVSPHPLSDENLLLVQEIGNFKIYKNTLNKPRAYFAGDGSPLNSVYLSPNKLIYQTDGSKAGKLILSEVFSPGWHAKIDGKQAKISETEIAQRSLDVPKDSKIIEIYYLPREFVWGLAITAFTIIFTASYAIYKKIKH